MSTEQRPLSAEELGAELEAAYTAIGSVQGLGLSHPIDPASKAELDHAFTLPRGSARGRAIVAALIKGTSD